MAKQLTLVVFMTAKPGKEEELGRRLTALIEPTRAEAGCITYDLHRSNTNPAVWMFYENWIDQTDLDLHFETEHLKQFLNTTHEVLEKDMEIHALTMMGLPTRV